MADSTDITVPDLGDFSDVEIIEVLVSEGDRVEKEDGLITLETDKATMDVPSPHDGVIEAITVSTGDRVSSGDTIGRMTVGDGDDDGGGKDERSGDTVAQQEPAATEEAASREGAEPAAKEDVASREVEEPAAERDEETGASASSTSEQTVTVPDLGDFSDVDVIEVLVAEGDTIAVDDPLVTLETDKAAMDVPSTVAGRILALKVKAGDKVSEGSELAVVEAASAPQETAAAKEEKKPAAGEAAAAEARQQAPQREAPAEAPREPAPAPQGPRELPPIDEAGFSRAHASPSVRKLARELGVDLAQVRGTGAKRRVLHEDVKTFVKAILTGERAPAAGATLPTVPKVDFARFGEIDPQPLTRIQKISGPRLQASWINLPHVTQHDLADITELEARRQELKDPARERGISLTPLAFIMKACISALKEFPKVNASLSGDETELVYKKYYHLGFAADTDQGLVVPVIRDADKLDVYELARALGELSKKAREGKLKADEMQGASFTISSLGGIGGTAFTPIVNAPEVAILGVSRSSMQPVWNGSEFEPRLMLPLSFSYDHRVVDGAYAVRFTTYLAQALTDVEALLEAIP